MQPDTITLLMFVIFFGYLIYSENSMNKRHEDFMERWNKLLNKDLSPREILSHENQEIRSLFIERWNGEGLQKIDESPEGILFSTEANKRVIKVINSTAEPDGTFKTYWLRVPTNINTAKEAVAWTFGLSGNEYNPTIET